MDFVDREVIGRCERALRAVMSYEKQFSDLYLNENEMLIVGKHIP